MASVEGLQGAFLRVTQDKWLDVKPECLDLVHAEAALLGMRVGFAAATVARFEPQVEDFYESIPRSPQAQVADILWMHWLGTPADSARLTVIERLEHPLLSVGRQLYPGRPIECGVVQPARLLPVLKQWQKRVYHWDEPLFYRRAVERVALFADFAVWIPWGVNCRPRRRKRGC